MGKGGPAGTKRKGRGSGGRSGMNHSQKHESIGIQGTASPFRLGVGGTGAGVHLLSSLTWFKNKLLGHISSLTALENFKKTMK